MPSADQGIHPVFRSESRRRRTLSTNAKITLSPILSRNIHVGTGISPRPIELHSTLYPANLNPLMAVSAPHTPAVTVPSSSFSPAPATSTMLSVQTAVQTAGPLAAPSSLEVKVTSRFNPALAKPVTDTDTKSTPVNLSPSPHSPLPQQENSHSPPAPQDNPPLHHTPILSQSATAIATVPTATSPTTAALGTNVHIPPPSSRRRGRPPGSKNRKRSIEGAPTPPHPHRSAVKKGRGTCFTNDEALNLAKAWVIHTHTGPSHVDVWPWTAIQKLCHDRFGMQRTAHSLRSAWSRLARDSHVYLASKAAIVAQRCSRKTSLDVIQQLAMQLFRQHGSRKDDSGNHVYAPAFKYIAAAEYLNTQSIFEKERADGSERVLNTLHHSGLDVIFNINVPSPRDDPITPEALPDHKNPTSPTQLMMLVPTSVVPSPAPMIPASNSVNTACHHAGRMPMVDDTRQNNVSCSKNDGGRTHQSERYSEEHGRVHKELEGIRKELARVNDMVADTITRDEDIALLHVLPSGSPEYNDVLRDVMKWRARRVQGRLAFCTVDAAVNNEMYHDGDGEAEVGTNNAVNEEQFKADENEMERR